MNINKVITSLLDAKNKMEHLFLTLNVKNFHQYHQKNTFEKYSNKKIFPWHAKKYQSYIKN